MTATEVKLSWSHQCVVGLPLTGELLASTAVVLVPFVLLVGKTSPGHRWGDATKSQLENH